MSTDHGDETGRPLTGGGDNVVYHPLQKSETAREIDAVAVEERSIALAAQMLRDPAPWLAASGWLVSRPSASGVGEDAKIARLRNAAQQVSDEWTLVADEASARVVELLVVSLLRPEATEIKLEAVEVPWRVASDPLRDRVIPPALARHLHRGQSDRSVREMTPEDTPQEVLDGLQQVLMDLDPGAVWFGRFTLEEIVRDNAAWWHDRLIEADRFPIDGGSDGPVPALTRDQSLVLRHVATNPGASARRMKGVLRGLGGPSDPKTITKILRSLAIIGLVDHRGSSEGWHATDRGARLAHERLTNGS